MTLKTAEYLRRGKAVLASGKRVSSITGKLEMHVLPLRWYTHERTRAAHSATTFSLRLLRRRRPGEEAELLRIALIASVVAQDLRATRYQLGEQGECRAPDKHVAKERAGERIHRSSHTKKTRLRVCTAAHKNSTVRRRGDIENGLMSAGLLCKTNVDALNTVRLSENSGRLVRDDLHRSSCGTSVHPRVSVDGQGDVAGVFGKRAGADDRARVHIFEEDQWPHRHRHRQQPRVEVSARRNFPLHHAGSTREV